MTTDRDLARLQRRRATLQKLWERKAERKQTLVDLKAAILVDRLPNAEPSNEVRQSVEQVLRRGA